MFSRKNSSEKEISVTITNETFFRIGALTIATIVLLLAVQKAAHALLLIFIAFFFALALNGPVQWVSRHIPGKRRGSRSLATALAFLLVVIMLGTFFASLVPPLVRQTNNFIDEAPAIVRDFRSQDTAAGRFIREHKLEKQVNNFSDQLSDRLNNIGGAAFSSVQRVSSSIFSLLTILVLTFMMLVEGPRWFAAARQTIPSGRRQLADRLAHDMYRVIRGFVNGQVTLAALAAVLIVPVLFILDIGHPIALGVIVFICGLIPMVGHTIGAIIITIVALFTATSAALLILAYYILYQQIENYFIQPKIQANSTNMSPLLIFMSVVIGVSFGGLVGGLFAIPIAGCLRIVLLEYLRFQGIIDSADYVEATAKTK